VYLDNASYDSQSTEGLNCYPSENTMATMLEETECDRLYEDDIDNQSCERQSI
jgi:hypothetical protein